MKYIFLIFLLIALIAGCSDEKLRPTAVSAFHGEIPSQESWNSTVHFTDSGRTKAILFAGHLLVYDSEQMTYLDSGVTVDFYNEDEIKTSTLTSLRGKVNDMTRDLWAIDSVVAVNDSGVTIKTDELMWRNKDQKIVSDKFVTITSDKEIIEGYGFESDQSLQNYVIYKITYVTRNDSL
jgi:LPS export ABC transporter protein LptC